MALQKTNLFCTKQNNIANTTFDLPKYTCNNSVKTKITFRKILVVQPLVTQPFDLAQTALSKLVALRSYVLTNNQANSANKFQQINSKPTNTTSTGFDTNNTIRTQFSRYNNIGDMHNPPA
jgi:hypothetical protein